MVHVRGLPWELGLPEVQDALKPMLPAGTTLIETILPLDKRARQTGQAMLHLQCVPPAECDVVSALQGQHVGQRWLEARSSTLQEMGFQRRQIDVINANSQALARQAYCRPEQEHTVPMPQDAREVVVLCHTPPATAAGKFDLSNLPSGRVDVLARCAAAALFVSHGVRRSVRLWLVLGGAHCVVMGLL